MPNPLFPSDAQPDQASAPQPAAIYSQPEPANTPSGGDPAVEMIRAKIRDLYGEEPDATTEAAEAKVYTHPGSPHQQYMRQLTSSGKSAVEIQAAWHAYYVALPDHEKYQVWQEFYAQNGSGAALAAAAPQAAGQVVAATQQPTVASFERTPQVAAATPVRAQRRGRQAKRAADIKKHILRTVKTAAVGDGGGGKHHAGQRGHGGKAKLQAKHHLQSLLFGLGVGTAVVVVFLFSFFNEFIIAPLIQPSRQVNDTPVIVDVASTVVSGGPKVLIPKINVEIPVDYSQTTTNEQSIELALDKGVVHYPTTVRPGQAGNAAFFGHSSNNIFNPGKYKFAFVLLHELVEGDIFYLTSDGKTYAYKVFSKRVVQPTEVGVLGPVAGHGATATLITCDPPGTSINRLVVVGDQISPDAAGNPVPATPTVETASTEANDLPGNGPTLWSRMWAAIF